MGELTMHPRQKKTVARDVMTKDPICVDRSATVHEIARIFAESEISGVPVVDLQNRVLGIVSKTDILNACLEGPPGSPRDVDFWDALRTGGSGTAFNPEDVGVAEDLMRTEDVTAKPDEPVSAVAVRMGRSGSHRVVVVDDDGHALGIVTSLDLVRLLAD
jgi:CBS domain-containing protein